MGWDARHGSPTPGGSILITSAPKSDMIVAAAGPAIQLAQSITFRPVNRLSVTTVPSPRWCGMTTHCPAGRPGQARPGRLRTAALRFPIGENDRPGCGEHAAHTMTHRNLCIRYLRCCDATHLPHTLLQRVHAVHAR